jgi:hypothetical protein
MGGNLIGREMVSKGLEGINTKGPIAKKIQWEGTGLSGKNKRDERRSIRFRET